MIGAELSIIMQPLLRSVQATKPRDTGLTLRAHQFGIKRRVDRPDFALGHMTASLAGQPPADFDIASLAAWLAD